MHALTTAGLGFLLAVLWFDLMFDVQAIKHRNAEHLPQPVVESIATYYRRVTTDASPMGRLVVLAMLASIIGFIAQIVHQGPRWYLLVAFLIAVFPMALAGGRVVPMAVRLGAERDTPEMQSRMARTILRDHLICVAMIATALVLQLAS
ncbi:MAG: hypothetical protein WCK14_04145 [Actinomycetota bacterium]